jgi:hypothetical protein
LQQDATLITIGVREGKAFAEQGIDLARGEADKMGSSVKVWIVPN